MAKNINLKATMVVVLLTISVFVQIHGESRKPAVRNLIDRASEFHLLNALTENESGTIRVPIIQFIEEHEVAFQKFSNNNANWEKVVEDMKLNLSESVSSQSDIKKTTRHTPHSARIHQMLAEIMAVSALQTEEKQHEVRKSLDQKLSVALEKYQAGKEARALSFKQHRDSYEKKRKELIKKHGKSLVEALEQDAEVWYQGVVRQHTLQKLDSKNR